MGLPKTFLAEGMAYAEGGVKHTHWLKHQKEVRGGGDQSF